MTDNDSETDETDTFEQTLNDLGISQPTAEFIDELTDAYPSVVDGQFDDGHCDRVVSEILDDVEMYTASRGGPEGPWDYKSLTVYRKMNTIHINDVDDIRVETLVVPDLSDHPDPHAALAKKLESVNSESLAAL